MTPERMMGISPQETGAVSPEEQVEAKFEIAELDEGSLKTKQSELRQQLVAASKELMNASLKGDNAKLAELTGQIETLNGQFKEIDERFRQLDEQKKTFKDVSKEEIEVALEPLSEFANLTEEEVDNAIKELDLLAETEEPVLLTPEMRKPIEITPDMIVSEEPLEKPVSEVEESLEELRQIERQRVEDEKQGKWKPAEKPKSEVEESLEELRQIERDRVAREAAEKAEKPPTASEVRGLLAKNELTPERKRLLERELQKMQNELFDIENGAVLIDKKTGRSIDKPGLKELESKFKKKYGLDLDTLAEKKAVSRWESFKIGLRSIFSRDYRRTIREYEERVSQFNAVKEDIDLVELQMKDPQKYAEIMDRRLLRLAVLNAKRKKEARSMRTPTIGTMKF